MTRWQLIFDSLRFHWRSHIALALGVAAGAAVLTGALVVGDSVRGSLRHITLDRLGRIDEVLVTDRFFRAALADDLAQEEVMREDYNGVVPAILLEGTVERPAQGGTTGEQVTRSGHVTVLGIDDQFSSLGQGGPEQVPAPEQIVINQTLADELGVRQGDELILRIGQASEIPPDSPLGRKHETVESRRLEVAAVVPSEGLGRFGLSPTQQQPPNAFVAVETLQSMLEQPKRVNALLVAGKSPSTAAPEQASAALQQALHPTLDDYGLEVHRTEQGYTQITSRRMLLDDVVVERALAALKDRDAQVAFTYLANSLAAGDREIPYSTITAVDFTDQPPLGPLRTPEGEPIGPLADDEIVLNTWAAEDLGVEPGATITVTYFRPTSAHGRVEETSVELKLKAIAALEGVAADRELTPELRGVTDQLSMADWDPPFPFAAGRIRREDEMYWEDYGATPKAFVSLATGQRLWGSRLGRATSVRFLPLSEELDSTAIAARIDLSTAEMGFVFRPVKRLGLAASAGTTPFSALFLGFSMFIIAAAVMLIALLFRLGVDRRAAEIGILTATGLRRRTVRQLMAWEGLAIAIIGAIAGTVLGVAYAWLMIVGLKTWWVEAITTPFLSMYVTPTSLILGFVSGVLVSWLAIVWALWQLRRVAVRRLLAGGTNETGWFARRHSRWARILGWGALAAAVALAVVASRLSGEQQAGAFFGSGALVLTGGLILIWQRLRHGATASLVSPGPGGLARLAIRNGARSPGRSALTIGLVAAASFLIVAISAFQLEPPESFTERDSGTGGFALVAETDQPLYLDLSPAGRQELGFTATEEELLADAETFALRVRPGDDASCLNLYQPQNPRVLGVPQSLIERGGFDWAASAADTPEERANPWLVLDKNLERDGGGDSPVPVVLDMNTAMYSLHLWNGVGERFTIDDGHGATVTMEVAGLLQNSIFQGDLLISDRNFHARFPDVNGYRFFLVATEPGEVDATAALLETALGDWGFDAERTDARLAGFFAVQNTYLSTFQSLGGLGLLLGTFGLAAVQLRNVLERRSELALLQATGFLRARLAWMVLMENAALLCGGLTVGIVAALVAVVPHWLIGEAAVPWLSLVATLGLVLVVGLLAGMSAVRATLRAPLLAALRGD